MPPHNSLNVSLTLELADYIAAQVASGRYRSVARESALG
jgi:Arc/MetJ-type ribon-helix-helix transcriptional regulator